MKIHCYITGGGGGGGPDRSTEILNFLRHTPLLEIKHRRDSLALFFFTDRLWPLCWLLLSLQPGWLCIRAFRGLIPFEFDRLLQ